MIRRLVLIAALAGALVATGAAPAHAAGQLSPKEAVRELDRARDLLDQAYMSYQNGRFDEAFTLARNSYLDHFELVEIPLRVRDERLTLAVEEDFAGLRSLIKDRAPASEVRVQVAEVRRGLNRVERELSSPGPAAPIVAAVYAFIILFREGFEAVLVVAALLGYLAASRNTAARRPVLAGVGAAGVATVLTFVLAATILRLAPIHRELLEAGTAFLAVGVLFYVSFWLISRLEHRRWMEFLKAKVWAAASTGSTLALAGVGFTAVYREGFETVLFYQALLGFARGLEGWIWLGTGVAAATLAGVGMAMFRAGRRIPVRKVLGTAVVMVMVLSVAFLGNAVRDLQEAAVIPVTLIPGLPRLPIFLAELTGYHPTVQTVVAQAVFAAVYLVGAAWMFVILPRRKRAAAPPAHPAPAVNQDAAGGG